MRIQCIFIFHFPICSKFKFSLLYLDSALKMHQSESYLGDTNYITGDQYGNTVYI